MEGRAYDEDPPTYIHALIELRSPSMIGRWQNIFISIDTFCPLLGKAYFPYVKPVKTPSIGQQSLKMQVQIDYRLDVVMSESIH